ncbi:MAG TPA: DUF3515 family protein [Kineosporiaceae bacterium]|nr:DUF3515 family protein [Kineosporiaceae bacterium]
MHRRPRLILLAPAALAAGGALALAACSDGPQSAPRADDPACTRALAAAPPAVLGRGRTRLDVRGAAAWGDPRIVLRCGLPALAPTTEQCLTVDGVDWVIADPDADPVVFTAYGREPTAELSVPTAYGRSAASGALVDVVAVARALPSNGRTCD